MQPIVNLFIVGAPKSGTTSLHRQLQNHPNIFMADSLETASSEKGEIDFFSTDSRFAKGESYLQSFLNDHSEEDVVGLSDVNLLFLEPCASRIKAYNAHSKILAILRNPIDRAYSAYWFAKRNGVERATSFEEAIDGEFAGARFDYAERNRAYLSHGYYAIQLRRYYDVFPEDQIRVLLTDEIDQNETWSAILEWLGVPNAERGKTSRHNEAKAPRYEWVQRLIRNPDDPVGRLYKTIVPSRIRRPISKKLTNRIVELNLVPIEYPAMNQGTRERLQQHFAPHNEELAKLLRRDISAWT